MSAVAIDRTGSTAVTEMFVLEPIAQSLGLAPVVLMPGSITIGSGSECDICLTVPGVQERHCVLKAGRGRVSVRALDRRTWQNNLPITESWLHLGDRLVIGPVEFRVRAVEPWDVLPASVSTRTIPSTASAHEERKSETVAERGPLEASLRQQIADLEASVARHQAAVARLEQQPAAAEAEPAPEPTYATTIFKIPTIQSVAPVEISASMSEVPAAPVLDAEHQRLLNAIEQTHAQTQRKLAELSVHEDSLQRQLTELEAQWELLHARMSDLEQATAANDQRAQQVNSREQHCDEREQELAARAQRFRQTVDITLQRQTQQQAEAVQLALQLSLITERQQALADRTQELDAREATLQDQLAHVEQRQADLEQQESEIRSRRQEMERESAAWNTWQENTEAELTQRAAYIETQVELHNSLAEELSRLDHQSKVTKTQLQQEAERLEAERTRLAVRQAELETLAAEQVARQQVEADHLAQQSVLLAEREQAATEMIGELAEHQTQLEEECASLEQRRVALEQLEETHRLQVLEATTEREAWQLSQTTAAAELAAQSEDLAARTAQIDLRATELAAQAADQTAREEELARRQQAWELQHNQLLLQQQQLEAERALLEGQRQDLEARTTANDSSAADLSRREQALDVRVSRLQQEQELLDAERNRLRDWSAELTSSAADVNAEATGVSQTQSELIAARDELQRIESEIEAFEQQLLDYEDQLATRDATLTAAEIDLAWHARTCELATLHSRTVPGDAARTEERHSETLSRTLEQVAADRDVLATELFAQSMLAEVESDDTAVAAHEVAQQAEQLRGDRETWQQQQAKLAADQAALVAEREELQRQQQLLEQSRQEQQTQWTTWQAEMAAQTARLQADSDALQARQVELESKLAEVESEEAALDAKAAELGSKEAELDAKSVALASEQESIEQLNEFLQTRHTELGQLREDLEQQLLEASKQAARHQAESDARAAEFEQREQQLAARGEALAQQEADWQAAQLELQQQRQAAELEQADWQNYQQSRDAADLDAPDDPASRALDSISDLDHLVQSELDQDQFPDREDHPLSNWNSPVASETPSKYDDADYDHYAADVEPAPVTDEDLEGSDLRAKLAEMFNLDLSKPVTESADRDESPDNVDDDYSQPQEDEVEDLPAAPPAPNYAAVAEPNADEYDSVESYMQRLLDRNRLSRDSLEASQQSRPQNESNPRLVTDWRLPEPVQATPTNEVEPEANAPEVPEPERSPVVRAAVDPRKVRAGLMSLRQVANDSARSAIAKSKWNKIRSQLLVQGLLITACTAVGGVVFVGQWLSIVQAGPWGWIAIGMGLGLGIKVFLDIRSIYDVDIIERPVEEPEVVTEDVKGGQA